MGFGFESGITSFFDRRQDFFKNVNIDGSFQERIKTLKDKAQDTAYHKPTVVVLGAGPAGLLRAIQSIGNGNPTILIERRAENAPGRINTVALTTTTISMLRYCGIYQYLTENRLIYPENGSGYIMVRLADLELAMNQVLKEISPTFAIQYNSKVAAIDSQSEKINLIVEDSRTKEKRMIKKIDILVNTEGKNSSTNDLLRIKRTEVLPSIPVIAAVYEDKRPKICGISSLLKYVCQSLIYQAQTIHYHVQFIFKFVFSRNFRKQITGSLILKTPQQNYVGCGFSDEINTRLESLKEEIREKNTLLEKLKQTGNGQEIKRQEIQLEQLEKKYKAFASQWIHFSICHANMVAIMQRFRRGPHLYTASHLSLAKFEIIKIGADHANEYCKSINQTSVLLGGDASATVDPTTGLGCNTAVQSSVDFLDFIWDYDTGSDQKKLLKEYSDRIEQRVDYIHKASKYARSLYRPDALLLNSNMALVMKPEQVFNLNLRNS